MFGLINVLRPAHKSQGTAKGITVNEGVTNESVSRFLDYESENLLTKITF